MRFRAIEHRLPSRKVTNADVLAAVRRASAKHLSSDELATLERLLTGCFAASGTRVRYHRADGETAVDLAAGAGEKALAAAGLDPGEIDLLIYSGVGRGVVEPATAAMHQHRLGLHRASAFDVMDACASWVRALFLAHTLVESGRHRNVMILNAECAGRESYRYELTSLDEFAHWHPTVTIGEAATATIVTASDQPDEFEADFRTYGDRWELCFVPLENLAGYTGTPLAPGIAPLQFVSYGLRLMEFGTRKLIEHYHDSPRFAAFVPDRVFGHAASDGASRHVLDACGIDPARYHFAHHKYGNTVSAAIPVAMSEALQSGELTKGDRVLLLMASSGVTTALVKFVFLP